MASRLADLKRRDGSAPTDPYSPSGNNGGHTPPAESSRANNSKDKSNGGGGDGMEDEVAPVQDRLDRLRMMNKELDAMQKEYLLEQDKQQQQLIDRMVARIGSVGLETNNLINTMNEKTQALRKKGASTTTVRLRNTQFTMLSNQLIELTKSTWNAQNKHSGSVKNSVARRLKVRYAGENGKTLNDEEAQVMAGQLIDSNQTDQVFALAREELCRVMRTKEEMAQIEFAMKTLHQIFMDMQLMVDEQSESVDVIGTNVEESQTNLERGAEALSTGRKKKGGCVIS